MAKSKSKGTFLVPDGAGGMTKVEDRRFEAGEWPIQFVIPEGQADTWRQHFVAECNRHNWTHSEIEQLEAKQNSGSISVNIALGGQQQLAVVWERKRNGPLCVRARSSGPVEFPPTEIEELFRRVNEASRTNIKERFFFRGWLLYEGLPWRGELWLDDSLRVGPPSKQDETALFGPRVILVDAHVDGIDRQHAGAAYSVRLRELSVFLSVVMGQNIQPPVETTDRVWTWKAGPGNDVECDTRQVGYWETDIPLEMPVKGAIPPVPRWAVERPILSTRDIAPALGHTEQHVAADLADLWKVFAELPREKRQQFLQAGSLWQVSLVLGHTHETAGYAFMVAACEALKPTSADFRDHNIYDVVEALLHKSLADCCWRCKSA